MLLLRDLDAATQAHGLAVPAGLISHTGVAGLTLGGGMGWLTRQARLSNDNLESAEIVTADGRILRAAEGEKPDLFWAIRGGGGNFGVVTEFEFRVHQVGPVVQFGLLFWDLDQGTQVLRRAREIVETLPRELNIVIAGMNAPPAPFVPDQYRFRPGYALLLTGFGASQTHEDVLTRIRRALPPLFEFVTPMPYVDLQQLLDEGNAWGFYCYDKSCYLEDLSEEVIAAVTEQLPQKNSPPSQLLFFRLDEAYCETGEDDTAFGGGRTPRFAGFVVGVCPTSELLPAERAFGRDRRICQCDERVRRGPAARHLRPHQVRAADRDQERDRSGERVSSQREHRARRGPRMTRAAFWLALADQWLGGLRADDDV